MQEENFISIQVWKVWNNSSFCISFIVSSELLRGAWVWRGGQGSSGGYKRSHQTYGPAVYHHCVLIDVCGVWSKRASVPGADIKDNTVPLIAVPC